MDAGKGLLSAAAGLLKAGRKSAQPLLENYLVDPRSGKSIKVPGITSRRNTEIHNKFPAVAGVEPGGLMFGRAEDIQGYREGEAGLTLPMMYHTYTRTGEARLRVEGGASGEYAGVGRCR